MIQKLLFVFCFIFAFAIIAAAQARTITNIDLDRYRQQRLTAEKDLNENYPRLGFPSPEERSRRDAESAKESAELSAKLRDERLERERLNAEREAAALSAQSYYPYIQNNGIQSDYGYYWSNGRRSRYTARPRVQSGYFAGGQFWSTGPRTQPRPLFVRPRH